MKTMIKALIAMLLVLGAAASLTACELDVDDHAGQLTEMIR